MEFVKYLLMTVLLLTAVFLIVLVLIQRGKGGGLAGALGGMGGQSAFGTKAGDLFTRITIGVAAFWIILCMFSLWYFRTTGGRLEGATDNPASSAPANPSGGEVPSSK
jgi:preprotein translocase subunit SecG